MTLLEMIRKELKTIEESEIHSNSVPFLRDDAAAIMICAMFKDRSIHYIMPDRRIVTMFVNDLVNVISKDDWDKLANRYKNLKLEPLIDKGEFEI